MEQIEIDYPADVEKTCSACRASLPISRFHRDVSKKEGVSSQCKSCKKSYFAALQKNDPSYRISNKARSAKWRETHEDAFRIWSAPRLDLIRAGHRAWVKAHPDKCKEYVRRRDALKKSSCAEKVDYGAILSRDGYWCHICQSAVDRGDISYDHVIPLARGGPHTMDNIKVSHRTCNGRKFTRLENWLR